MAATLAVAAVASVGGLAPPPGQSAIPGGLKMSGDVETVGGDIKTAAGSLNLHTHMLVGVKAGPDAGTTLNIGASAAKAVEIAAAKAAAEEAARRAAEEEARRQAEEAAAAAAAENPQPDYSG
jgi:hypothetical protein